MFTYAVTVSQAVPAGMSAAYENQALVKDSLRAGSRWSTFLAPLHQIPYRRITLLFAARARLKRETARTLSEGSKQKIPILPGVRIPTVL